jgi:DUF971 family protein
VTIQPLRLQRDEAERVLVVEWSDGLVQRVPYRVLRDNCPCAVCRTAPPESKAAQSGLRVLTPAQTRPLDIVRMSPAGNYAYYVEFSDGHTSGIFTFDLLRSLQAPGDR